MLDLAADSAVFMQDFAETVRFRAAPGGASPRSVRANVNRQPIDEANSPGDSPTAGRRSPKLHVMLRNHASLGVLPTEIVADTSEIEVAYPLGAAVRWRRVLRIVKHNAGCLIVEVQS